MLVDVFTNYNTVVYQNTNHDDHPEEGNDVDGYAHQIGTNKHTSKRDRNSEGHPEGQAPVQKHCQEGQYDQESDDSVFGEQLPALLKYYTTITRNGGLYFAVAGVEIFNVFFHHIRNGDHVFFQGVLYGDDHRWLPVEVGAVGRVRPTVAYVGHLV